MNTFSLAEFVDEKEETNALERVAFLLRLHFNCGNLFYMYCCLLHL